MMNPVIHLSPFKTKTTIRNGILVAVEVAENVALCNDVKSNLGYLKLQCVYQRSTLYIYF